MDLLEDNNEQERYLIQKAADAKRPIKGSLELTPLCNMDCDMCYVRLSQKEMKALGQLQSLQEWRKISRQMQKAGILFLLLTGGEPLSYPNFRPLYLELLKMGFILTINSNGTLLNEEWASFLGHYPPRCINVTLYGSNDQTYQEMCHFPGGFEKVIEGVKLLRKKNVAVKLACSLTRKNKNEWEKIINIGKSLGVPVRLDTYLFPVSRERAKAFDSQCRPAPEEAAAIRLKALRRELGDRYFLYYLMDSIYMADHPTAFCCMAGLCSFTINWQGQMRPCVMMTGPAVSLKEHSFSESWEILLEETSRIHISSICQTCSLQNLCQPCLACALSETGSYDKVPEYRCRYTHEIIRLMRSLIPIRR